MHTTFGIAGVFAGATGAAGFDAVDVAGSSDVVTGSGAATLGMDMGVSVGMLGMVKLGMVKLGNVGMV